MINKISEIFSLMRKNWALTILTAAIACAVFFIIIFPLSLTFGRINTPRFCVLCHETQYDYKDYAVNVKGHKMPRGVLVGCAECHPQPYFEYKSSEHYKSKKEHRPGCANCHKPHTIAEFAGWMYLSTPPWEKVMESMTKDMEMWEKDVRPAMAKKVREELLRQDSATCKECHSAAAAGIDADLEPHKIMVKAKLTCIECHFNIVHKKVPWPEMEEKKKKLGID